MMHEAAGLLISAAAGYLVLERADKHKGFLHRTGLVVGTAIVVASFLGLACIVSSCSTGWASCPMKKGGFCPMMSKAK